MHHVRHSGLRCSGAEHGERAPPACPCQRVAGQFGSRLPEQAESLGRVTESGHPHHLVDQVRRQRDRSAADLGQRFDQPQLMRLGAGPQHLDGAVHQCAFPRVSAGAGQRGDRRQRRRSLDPVGPGPEYRVQPAPQLVQPGRILQHPAQCASGELRVRVQRGQRPAHPVEVEPFQQPRSGADRDGAGQRGEQIGGEQHRGAGGRVGAGQCRECRGVGGGEHPGLRGLGQQAGHRQYVGDPVA